MSIFEKISDDEFLELAKKAGREIARKYRQYDGDLLDARELAAASIMETLEKKLEPWRGKEYVYTVLRDKAELHYRIESYNRRLNGIPIKYKVREIRPLLLAAVWMLGDKDKNRLYPYADNKGKVDWIEAKYTDDGKELWKPKPHPVWVRFTDLQMSYAKLRPAQMDAIEAVCVREEPKDKNWQRATESLTRHINRRISRMREEDNPNEKAFERFKGGPGVREARLNRVVAAGVHKQYDGSNREWDG